MGKSNEVGAADQVTLGAWHGRECLEAVAPSALMDLVRAEPQRAFPALAKDPFACAQIQKVVHSIDTRHLLRRGDSRSLELDDESVDLAVTSPPYWTLKKYNDHEDQLADLEDYECFLAELDEVWRRVYRALVPGGRLVVVVGDVNLSRRAFGRHVVYPLHASIQEHCRSIGFDNLAPIIWYKIANAQYEVGGGGGFFGKPYEPNGVIKNDVEFILFQRKPGGYRKPSLATRLLSIIPADDHAAWFQQVWRLSGASTAGHPAPFPVGLAERLIRMFSFVGDVVLDPFVGTGTTSVAAAACGRNSIGYEVDPEYFEASAGRLRSAVHTSVQGALDLTA